MKERLPRKLKKAMLTEQRLFDKSLGFKCRRAIMKKFMYYKYLRKLYRKSISYDEPVSISYDEPITVDHLRIANKLLEIANKYTSPA